MSMLFLWSSMKEFGVVQKPHQKTTPMRTLGGSQQIDPKKKQKIERTHTRTSKNTNNKKDKKKIVVITTTITIIIFLFLFFIFNPICIPSAARSSTVS